MVARSTATSRSERVFVVELVATKRRKVAEAATSVADSSSSGSFLVLAPETSKALAINPFWSSNVRI